MDDTEVIVNDPKPQFLTEARRAWIYRVSLAILLLAQLYRWVDSEESNAIANVISAVLAVANSGLATLNTSTHKEAA